MERKYYLHRIKHEAEVAYALKELGYLTLGWSEFSDTDILAAAREIGYPRFDVITAEKKRNKDRSRWNMWYFAQFKADDIVIVPLDGGLFSVYKVCKPAEPISVLQNEFPSIIGFWNHHKYVWGDGRLIDSSSPEKGRVDLGFCVRVLPIVVNVPRDIAVGRLTSRMKIQTTNADISDLKDDIEAGIDSVAQPWAKKKPISIYEYVNEQYAKILQDSIENILDDIKFERLIKWYLDKVGATSSWIPPKNERGKKNGADADVVGVFDHLKLIVLVQAKHHRGKTSGWGVTQIREYYNQMPKLESFNDYGDYTIACWVITSAGEFSKEACQLAEEGRIRLIDGREFAKMLVDVGIRDIDEANK